MSEPKLISPMLDRFMMGDPISDHNGVRCCPAMDQETESKYIVKIISIPASQIQLDALLLTGAYPDKDAALEYFKAVSDDVVGEAEILSQLSAQEGFIPFEGHQLVPMEDGVGYDVYLLAPYKRTLEKQLQRVPVTHLDAINLGLDMCAALAVCRRSGYLYADLKPRNIFLTDSGSFKIGDLGFLKLSTLKYTSLPDKYRSQYTAPEIQDAFSTLNDTIDIYALGLILYQVYNGGQLPELGEKREATPFPPPAYADYEMAEIILKACAFDPADRWQDPMQMGQALVSYMQRNGANDDPIIPPAEPQVPEEAPEEDVQEEAVEEIQAENEAITPDDAVSEEIPEEAEEAAEEQAAEAEEAEESDVVYTEDDFGNFTFMDTSSDETAPEHNVDQVSYDEVTEELSDILTQADDLANHPVPDPVVVPDPVEVELPAEATEDAEQESSGEEAAEETVSDEISEEEPETDDSPEKADDDSSVYEENARPVKSSHWVRNTLLVLLALALIVAGIFFYRHYYLQPINSIRLEGTENSLTVYVDSEVDESLLTVVCTDTYGNYSVSPVIDGKAVFTDLAADTGYTVNVRIQGFHKLTGDVSDAYSTPVQTNIIQFQAATGAEEGSVLISFRPEGSDSDQWTITYWAQDEEERVVTFAGHTVTISGLTLGKEYQFRVAPVDPLYISGEDTISYVPGKLVYAQNLTVISLADGKLSVRWDAPAETPVASWTVRCNSGTEYDQTITTDQTTATFEGLDHTAAFTVEVTAENMSLGTRIFVDGNAATLTGLTADTSSAGIISLTWSSPMAPAGGWIISYTVDGIAAEETVSAAENAAQISGVIPGAQYVITVNAADGSAVLGNTVTISAPQTGNFSATYTDGGYSYTSTSAKLFFHMCHTPSVENWDRFDLALSDFTTTYSAGQKASFLVEHVGSYGVSGDPYAIVLAIRDSAGTLLDVHTVNTTWSDMWNRGYSELDIPELPQEPGNYHIDIYFNGSLAGQTDFTITQ